MIEDNDKPYHCCVCGCTNVYGLCKPCHDAHMVPAQVLGKDGKIMTVMVLHPAVREMMRWNNKETQRDIRNRKRVERGTQINGKAHGGARFATGVKFVSLDSVAGYYWLDHAVQEVKILKRH